MTSDPREPIVVSGREARGGTRDRSWAFAGLGAVALATVAMAILWFVFFA